MSGTIQKYGGGTWLAKSWAKIFFFWRKIIFFGENIFFLWRKNFFFGEK